mmetsp:Transcript_32362/g.57927  ORF Transcript_32362/g.57927 Transcript_32362/m.57927 type:complete len:281 (+) Transcript_32362:1325-2167(+)
MILASTDWRVACDSNSAETAVDKNPSCGLNTSSPMRLSRSAVTNWSPEPPSCASNNTAKCTTALSSPAACSPRIVMVSAVVDAFNMSATRVFPMPSVISSGDIDKVTRTSTRKYWMMGGVSGIASGDGGGGEALGEGGDMGLSNGGGGAEAGDGVVGIAVGGGGCGCGGGGLGDGGGGLWTGGGGGVAGDGVAGAGVVAGTAQTRSYIIRSFIFWTKASSPGSEDTCEQDVMRSAHCSEHKALLIACRSSLSPTSPLLLGKLSSTGINSPTGIVKRDRTP